MSPTFSKAALRVLVSILLASSLANAAALPHQVLDPRAPLTEDIPNPEEALQAIQSAVKQDPGNFFDNISDDLSNRSAWQVFLDFVTRLFGPRENSNGAATTTVFVTPTPSDIILPPGPPTATSVVLTSTSTEISTSTSIEVSTSTSTEIPSISTTIPTSISTEVSTNTTTEVSTSTSTEIEILTSISSEVPTITLTEVSTSTSTEIEILTSISTEVSLNISTVIPTNTSSSEASSTTEKPFSILPIEPITTAINATFLTPVFSTGPEISLPLLTPSVGIPPFPANSSYEYVLPTAVPITGEFSTTIPVELLTSSVPLAINSSEPTGTGLPLPWAGNTTESAINPTLILTEPVAPTPVTNESEALNSTSTTLSLTSIIIVTETIIPSPLSGTGIEASASVGTGIPISEIASPLWPNSTFVEPTILPGTGTGSPSIGTALPLSDLPIYPNVTNATTSAVAEEPSIVLLPITVTGLPGGTIGVTVTIPTAPFPNTTVTESSIPLGTGSLEPSAGTELPVPESEIPLFPNTTFTLIAPTTIPFPSGTGPSIETILPIETLSESVPYPNTTTETVVDIATDTATATLILPSLPTETIIDNATETATETLILPSLPIETIIDNATETLILPGLPTETIIDIATDTATATLILPSLPTATDAAIEFPGQLNATLPVVLPESDLVLAPTEGYKH